ncbi:MAG: Smr/MutS family protein [Zoogloeaceae bacterium]|jgi:DNA-nicking Smr family endonuclease|nr:Smr/MutS family protein [Zoogloeaceae bacterium]
MACAAKKTSGEKTAGDATAEDQAAWRREVADVVPIKTASARSEGSSKKIPPRAPVAPGLEERGARSALLDLRIGRRAVSVRSLELKKETEEKDSFRVSGVPRRIVAALRRGQPRIGDELDLHGMTRDEAEAALLRFLETARSRGIRAVRLIHGQGHSSPAGMPVLRALSREWLRAHPAVLAFCFAPPKEGGAGATLILLRRDK